MAPADWQRFSDALKEAFPQALYVMKPTKRQISRSGSRPPRVLIAGDLLRAVLAAIRWRSQVSMVFDPEWRPVWRQPDPESGRHNWHYWAPRHPSVDFDFRFQGGIRQVHGQPIHIKDTWINFRCNPAFKDHYLLAGRFYRLLGKFCSNRNLMEVRYPDGAEIERYEQKGAWIWVGYDARQWALRDPLHFLYVHPQRPQGLRPLPAEQGNLSARRRKVADLVRERLSGTTLAGRSHFVAMGPNDMQALSSKLAEVFPAARYYMEPFDDLVPFRRHQYRETPRLLVGRNLLKIWRYSRLWRTSAWMVFDENWRVVWHRDWINSGKPSWLHWRPKLPLVHFENIRGACRIDGGPWSVRLGLISFTYDAARPEHCALSSRFSDALSEVASKRNLAEVDMKTGATTRVFTADDEAWAWIGHNTRGWAEADPQRFATISAGTVGLRPIQTRVAI